MKRSLAVMLTAPAITLAACSATPSAAPSTATPAAVTPSATAAAAAATLAPYTPGHFPSTTDGKLAAHICTTWAGLRAQYAQRAAADTPYQLNQWFSSPAWKPVQNDAAALGNDPAYDALETALGVAMVGDMAGISTARQIDKACEAG